MLNATELRNSAVFLKNNNPYKVLNYEHVKTARGGATIKVKAVDLQTGTIKPFSFSNNEKVDEADIENRDLQFLYQFDDELHFMDSDNYDQVTVSVSVVQDESKYLLEGKEYQVVFFDNNPISIVLPPSIFFKVAEAPPAVKGNTATTATKIVILENGLKVDVPQFIKEGDTVKINTSSGEYSGRGQNR